MVMCAWSADLSKLCTVTHDWGAECALVHDSPIQVRGEGLVPH